MNTPVAYNIPVANPFEKSPGSDFELEQEPLFEESEKATVMDWLKDNAHNIAFATGNLLLAAGEYRVFDFVYLHTGEIWKGIFAVLASFVPFVLWEIAVQHAKASGLMRLVAWAGLLIAFGLGVYIGIADFILPPDAHVDGILGFVAFSLSLHAVLFLAFFYAHPDIKAKRLVAQALARQDTALQATEVSETVLLAARNRLELERRIASEYGYENLRRVLAELEGKSYRKPQRFYQPRPAASAASAPPPLFAGLGDERIPAAAPVEAAAVQPAGFSPNGHQPNFH